MGFTEQGHFPEGRAGTAVVRGTNLQAVMQKPRHRKVSGFLFSDGRRTGRGVAIRDRCVGPGEFISAPGTRKSCGFRTLHEI